MSYQKYSELPWQAQSVGYRPTKQKFTGFIPGQDTCLGVGLIPSWGERQSPPVWLIVRLWKRQSDWCFSLTSTFLSLSPSFPLSLNKWIKSFKKYSELNSCNGCFLAGALTWNLLASTFRDPGSQVELHVNIVPLKLSALKTQPPQAPTLWPQFQHCSWSSLHGLWCCLLLKLWTPESQLRSC